MNPSPESARDPVTLDAGRLRMVFSRSGDRYQHEIQAAGEPRRILLASLEGGADAAWPASPPFQELHVERRGEEKLVALLVGRAGRSHWSGSVELDRSRETILFDVACRCAGSTGWLGSTYELPSTDAATLGRANATIVLPPDDQLQILEGEPHWIQTDDGCILRIAARRTVSRSPQTIRWQYSIGPCE